MKIMNNSFIQEYVDALVKKAYDNWHQVVEYDGKAFSNSKQTRRTRSSQNELPMNTVSLPNAVDGQLALPLLPIPMPTEKQLGHPSVGASGKALV